jgi:cation diffusion facilitator family transporter
VTTHVHDLRPYTHDHAFDDAGAGRRQRALALVAALTLVTMAVELAAGWWTASLALLADGWHMGTHALALGGAVLAYRLAVRARTRSGYAFGGWKIEVLAAYTSALALAAVAVGLVIDAVQTLRAPVPIAYREAIAVALLGLVVNVASVWLLARGTRPQHEFAPPGGRADDHRGGHQAHQGTAGHHDHHDHHHDHNFSAAYWHVIADALTSVLAIAALAGGLWFGWAWLDPAAALLGAALIARWSWQILKRSSRALVDATQEPQLAARVRSAIEADGDAKVADLHVWQVGARSWCGALTIVADSPLSAADYHARLHDVPGLHHLTVEVHRCPGC